MLLTILFWIVVIWVGSFLFSTFGQGSAGLPATYPPVTDDDMCPECGVKSAGTRFDRVCNECSRDWTS